LALSHSLRGELRYREPLSQHTTWRVGGPADLFYLPADNTDLLCFLEQLPPEEPLFWLGLGSNLLVRDGGIRGTVLCTAHMHAALTSLGNCRWHIDAGASCAKIARFSAREDCRGAEFLAGIPGTLGGALSMNAGAFGAEIWPLVECVNSVNRYGETRQRLPQDYRIGYRQVEGPPGEWFISAILRLDKGGSAASASRIRALLDQRKKSQPIGLPSCGSVFRNPLPTADGQPRYAAQLIEAAGLKGMRLGGAQVSEKHANFIINISRASAVEIEQLITTVQAQVKNRFGVDLQREVKIVGEK
jgi:UDP-N-acetylmuramate dehydrogenase